jgi:hypothetical protein
MQSWKNSCTCALPDGRGVADARLLILFRKNTNAFLFSKARAESHKKAAAMLLD